ncbi:MAG TPA: HDOD domain-containing protein [Planctomycetota bacterium]|nr:HDOD domain-containing protein [Planctomycetota bacterium]
MPSKTFEELKATGALPSPPGVGMEILRIIQNENCSVDELAKVIQSDPALTGRLLQIANSALFGSGRPCATIKEATMRLGLRSVRSVALGFSLVSAHRAGACEGFDYGVYWSQSLARAVAAHALSSRFRIGMPAEVFVAALLSDLGSLALATVHPRDYTDVLRARETETAAGRAVLEQKRFGIDHREVTAAMLREWRLPESFAVAAASVGAVEPPPPERRGPSLTHVVWIAARFATAFVLPEDRPLDPELVQRALGHFPEWKADDLSGLWAEIAESWRRWGNLLDIVTTAVPPYGSGIPPHSKRGDPITLRATAPATAAAAAGEAGDGGAPPRARILAVDDDPTSLRLLAAQLEKDGHDVTRASNGREALKLAMQVIPQIVIADWQMPEMNGVALCRSLRAFEAGRRVYMILLTGEHDEDSIVEAFNSGLDDYVIKPFKPKLLLARVRSGMRVVKMQERIDADKATMQRQVAELGVLNRRLQETADTDVLTTLPNRRFAMSALREAWERSLKEDDALSIVMVDVDKFKRVNDSHGHDVGDQVLRETADVLRLAAEPPATVCRYGGEEFVAILPGFDGAAARAFAMKLRRNVESHAIRFGGFDGRVTASFGVSTRVPGVTGFEQMLKLADEGLYRAKEGGRNQVSSVQLEEPHSQPVAPLPLRS